MQRKSLFTKILAITGTLLAVFPILATLATSLFGSLRGRIFRFDYLMPAELFPIAIAGGGLLLWAALRAKARRRLIGWGLGVAVALLVGSQALAVASGLASGETEPVGLIWALVLGGIVTYALALIVIDIAGVLLVRDVFQADER